jgi:hypothetical protein
MDQRRRNWHPWVGFLLSILGVLSYFLVFTRYPVTRDTPWANFLILAAGIGFVISGLRRAYGRSQQYRGKIAGPILALLSLFAVGSFCFLIFYATKQMPKAADAPRVGQKAPEFILTDTNHKEVSLADLMTMPLPNSSTPPKGVFLVFYRGYW